MDLCTLLYFLCRSELEPTGKVRNCMFDAVGKNSVPLAKDVANMWANKYLVFPKPWVSDITSKMHDLIILHHVTWAVNINVLFFYQVSNHDRLLFLFFRKCKVFLVFLLFPPNMDWIFLFFLALRKPKAWKGKRAMFMFRVEIKICCYISAVYFNN